MRFSLSRPRALAAASLAALAVAAAPAVAGAQSLQSVAITTHASADTLVLDVSGGSTANGARVIQWYGSFAANQRWNFVDQGDGTQTIVNQKSGKCLTTDGVAGHQLYQFTCVGSPLQKWSGTLDRTQAYEHSKPLTNPYSGLRVDVSGASQWAGAGIIAWYPNDGANQQFTYYQLF
jgi:hypothetical protein